MALAEREVVEPYNEPTNGLMAWQAWQVCFRQHQAWVIRPYSFFSVLKFRRPLNFWRQFSMNVVRSDSAVR